LSLAAGLFVALILAGVALGFAKRNSALAAQNAESARFANTQQAIAIDQESIAAQSAATAVAAREEAEGLASLRSRDAQVNQSLALAAQSQLARQADNVDLALALAMEANRIPDPPGPAQMALSEAAYAPGTVRVFLGHEAPVQSVAVSPDGRYGISGDESGLVILWNLDTGEVLRRLEGHTDTVASLAFTPDGRHAVSASQDKTLIYWDLEEGEIIRRLTGHIDAVNTVAVSPDGRFAASGSGRGGEDEDNSLRLWDLQSGQEARRFTFFRYSVNDVSFTPNGEHLVVGTETEGFIVLNIKTGKALVRNNIIGMMAEVVVTPDGRFALTADSDYSIHIWDLQTGQVVTELESHNSTIYGLAISPDGKRALGGSKVVIEYDLETGEQLNQFNFGANAIAYLPNGHAALVGSQDQTLRLLALESGTEIGRLPASIDWIRGAAYSPQGRTLVANDTQYLSLWDLETGDNIWNATADTSFWEITLSPDGKQILVGGWGGFVGVYDAASGEMLNRLESDGSFEGHDTGAWVDTVAFHPNGKFALSGSQATGDHLIYWDLETGKPVWLFDTGWRNVLGVAISPDGRTALSAEEDGSLELWDLETGQLIRSLAGHTNVAWSVAFIDDQTAISASEDSTMILWDLKSGTALRSFLGHASGIKRVVISPDKRLALSASRDGTLILWNIQNGEPLRHYAGHTDELMTVAWHPDGEEALSGGRDGQAIRWRIDADLETFLNWVEGNRYVRRLTCAERDAFNAEPLCDSASLLPAARPDGTPTPVQGSQAALLPPLPTPTPLASSPATAPLVAEAAGAAAWGVNRGSVHLGGGQVWEYAGNAGDQLSILVAADQPANMTWGIERQRENGLLDPTMSLYAPDGSLLTEDDDLEEGIATDAYLESITLPQTGIYQIEVRSYQDQTGGSYRLVLADPRRLAFQVNPDGMLSGLAFYPDGQRLLVSEGWKYSPDSNSFSIWVWDLASDEMIQQLDGHQEWITGLALSPDGRQALSADAAGVAILWDLESGEEIRRFDNSGSGILFLPDGQTALMASRDWSLALWDLASGEVIRRFEGHADEVRKVVLSQDGEVAYSTSADQTVRAWRVATGELIATYQPFASESTCGLAISPDSRKLLVGNDWSYCVGLDPMDAAIALLDTETGETLLTLEGHTGGVRSIAFSPDGRYALSGAGDTTVRLWDVSTGKQLAVLTGHTSWVSQVAFSSDGLTGYSTGEDGSFRVWDLSEFIGTEPSASTEN
jgi:WD40 repeat protein